MKTTTKAKAKKPAAKKPTKAPKAKSKVPAKGGAPVRRGDQVLYWLMKSEPDAFSWEQCKQRGAKGEPWTGVRNFLARNNMRAMKIGDLGFFLSFERGTRSRRHHQDHRHFAPRYQRRKRQREMGLCRCRRRVRHADAGYARRREGEPETQGHEPRYVDAAIGAAGGAGRVDRGLPHGRSRPEEDRPHLRS